MADEYQALRDYAALRLPHVEDRQAFIDEVVGFARFQNDVAGDVEVMMAERIARHAWDSTPHKVIPHAHLSPDQIPPGAKSPPALLSDSDRAVDAARRLQENRRAQDAGNGPPAAGAQESSAPGKL